jgi:hypothetical protein
MGVAKFVLGRWKSGGGATWTCVADPGSAQSGTAGASAATAAGSSSAEITEARTANLRMADPVRETPAASYKSPHRIRKEAANSPAAGFSA